MKNIPMCIQKTSFKKDESGIAAIEFGLIFPVLVIMFFGLIDLTGYIGTYRKATLAASIVGDLVAQNKNTVPTAQLTDYYKAAYMVTNFGTTSDAHIKVSVFDYRKNAAGAVVQQWTHSGGNGPTCAAPSTTGLATLMTGNNDIIATQVCMTFHAYVGFGSKTYTISDTIYVRPRVSATIDKGA